MAPTGPGTPSAYAHGAASYGPGSHVPSGYGQGPYAPGGPSYPGYGAGHAHAGQAYAHPVPYGAGWPHDVWRPDNAQGTAALVLGIVGLVLFFSIVFGIVLGALAIIFGALGRGKARRGEANNGGAALAGIIIGIVACAASVAMIFVYAVTGVDEDGEGERDEPYGSTALVRAQVLAEGSVGGA